MSISKIQKMASRFLTSRPNGWSNPGPQELYRRVSERRIEWAFIRGSSFNRLETRAKLQKNWNLKSKKFQKNLGLKIRRQYFRSPRQTVENTFALKSSSDAAWKNESHERLYQAIALTFHKSETKYKKNLKLKIKK